MANALGNRLKMRLAMARQAITDLQSDNLTPSERIDLYRLIERLTAGKIGKPGPRKKKTESLFQ